MQPPRHPAPVVPPETSLPELTWVAIALGLVLSVVMGAANTYLGLYAGMTVSASIPAAVISMGLLRTILRRSSILENNMVQTMASTGEALAAGVIFTVPALLIVGAWQEFQFWPTTVIVLLGGVLGLVFMVPMRKALIVDRPDLAYPEGVACAEVLKVGEEGGVGARTIGIGIVVGAVFKLLVNGLRAVQPTVEGAMAAGRSVLYFGADMSAALVAIGYIVRLEIAVLVFLGGALGWLVALPLLAPAAAAAAPLDVAWDVWTGSIRFIGVGAMIVGGLASFWQVRQGIVSGIASLSRVGATVDTTGVVIRTERNIALGWLAGIFLIVTAGTVAFYNVLTGSMGIAAVTAIVMVLTSFVLVAVATYIAGLVGSSNSPVSGMTIMALLVAAGAMLGLGIAGDSAILATLGVAGVVCCATSTSGDLAQDLKTGLLVGATPVKQQIASFFAAVVPAFFFAPILTVLHQAYGIGTGEEGSLRAPQAALFASLTSGFFGEGDLPWDMIGIGAAVGVVLIGANAALARAGVRFRAHVMPVAVGLYLPFSLAVPILIGGLLHHRFGPRAEGDVSRDDGVLFGSGLIAGEALIGIGLAGVIVAGTDLPIVLVDHPAPSLLLFAVVLWWLARVAKKSGRTR